MGFDYQNFSWARTGSNRQITVPDVKVSLQMTDPTTGAILKDFTGANAIDLWNFLGTLTTQNQDFVFSAMINTCLMLEQQS